LQKKFLIPVLALAVAFAVYLVSRRPARVSSQSEKAPDFSLPDLTGRPVTLSSYRSKVVLLDFWATWCGPCRDEIPRYIQLQNHYGDQGLQIIGISMDDSLDPVRAFYRDLHMNYPVVMGGAKTGELYGGILGLPIAFVVGRDGRIVAKHIGATDTTVLEQGIRSALAGSEQSGK
jgi:thiol-disulfide isomerase/thioredoxin